MPFVSMTVNWSLAVGIFTACQLLATLDPFWLRIFRIYGRRPGRAALYFDSECLVCRKVTCIFCARRIPLHCVTINVSLINLHSYIHKYKWYMLRQPLSQMLRRQHRPPCVNVLLFASRESCVAIGQPNRAESKIHCCRLRGNTKVFRPTPIYWNALILL